MLALCCSLAACGRDGDGGHSDTASLGTCGLKADVTGGASLQFSGDDNVACATQHSFDSGLEVLFVHVESRASLELKIGAVTEGETGSDFVTRVIVSAYEQRFQGNACLTTITEHELLETEASAIGELRHYQVSGEGSCPDALSPEQAEVGEATLDSFAFRAQFTWRD